MNWRVSSRLQRGRVGERVGAREGAGERYEVGDAMVGRAHVGAVGAGVMVGIGSDVVGMRVVGISPDVIGDVLRRRSLDLEASRRGVLAEYGVLDDAWRARGERPCSGALVICVRGAWR